MMCRVLKLRIHTVGAPAGGQPVLVVGNHVSYLDIPVISAIRPMAFVAKQEVAAWPMVGAAARLMHCVFVDRTRRQDTGEVNAEIADRLAGGESIVLFAEGTSSDGNRVLEFRSALIGAATNVPPQRIVLQPMSIAYTRQCGLPMGRRDRTLVAWYGDLDLTPHLMQFVRRGVVDVTVTFGAPVPLGEGTDRKSLTRQIELEVRRLTTAAARHRIATPSMAT
jgi:1-acyl-sn-glycerol-3-phosphate acyltransferase